MLIITSQPLKTIRGKEKTKREDPKSKLKKQNPKKNYKKGFSKRY